VGGWDWLTGSSWPIYNAHSVTPTNNFSADQPSGHRQGRGPDSGF